MVRLARASTTLVWVGVQIPGHGMRAWDVSYSSDGNNHKPVLTEMEESDGQTVVKAKRMDEFQDMGHWLKF